MRSIADNQRFFHAPERVTIMTESDSRKSRKSNFLGIWLFLLSIFVLELIVYAWCRNQYIQTGYRITSEIEVNRSLMAQQSALMIELTRLKSPERISTIARNQLKLDTPFYDQIIKMP